MTNFYYTHDIFDARFIEEDANILVATSKEEMVEALLGSYEFEDGEQAWLISLSTSDCWIKTNSLPDDDLTAPFTVDECYVTSSHPGTAKYWVSPAEEIYGLAVGTPDQLEYALYASFKERVK